jgi:hypothetical protein
MMPANAPEGSSSPVPPREELFRSAKLVRLQLRFRDSFYLIGSVSRASISAPIN